MEDLWLRDTINKISIIRVYEVLSYAYILKSSSISNYRKILSILLFIAKLSIFSSIIILFLKIAIVVISNSNY